MSTDRSPLKCPGCDARMNCHAEKAVTSIEAGDEGDEGEAIGAVIEQAHSCPECGINASRRLVES